MTMPSRSPHSSSARASDPWFSLQVVAAFAASVGLMFLAQAIGFAAGVCADRHVFISAFGLTNTGLMLLPFLAFIVYKRLVQLARILRLRPRHHVLHAKGRHSFS
ncbi:hypothetical protein ACHHYP_04340 [Achlya hypogyna]|uniref:Uncharacterized protein n=1 Tax=Achlya hypogyna TaxID=1202772 RepID=A0A1V9Z1X5_ACHHY|nr:hypothetical protein ACHHYP_04340 [Achlya hypogyna]